MTEEKKHYPKLEELLAEGEHILKVKPHPLFDDSKKPIPNSQKSGNSEWGNWYMYDTKVGEQWVSIFANDKNKDMFDSGYVKANVVPKRMKGMTDDLFDSTGKKLLKAFYNELSEVELVKAAEQMTDSYVLSEEKKEQPSTESSEEKEISIDEIDF